MRRDRGHPEYSGGGADCRCTLCECVRPFILRRRVSSKQIVRKKKKNTIQQQLQYRSRRIGSVESRDTGVIRRYRNEDSLQFSLELNCSGFRLVRIRNNIQTTLCHRRL